MKQEPGRQQPGIPSLQGGEEVNKRDIEQVILDMLPAEPGASTTALSQTAGIASDRVFRVLLKLEKAASMRLSRMEAIGLVRNVGMQHLDRGRPARIFEVANA